MADSPLKKSTPFRWRRWLKILGYICGILVVLLVIAYFVVTSAGFFKGVILPRVSKAVGADVTVGEVSIHPFSHVVLSDLKVQVKGADPILTAKEVRASYSLWSIISGNIVVNEVAMVSPVISLVTKPDGSDNLPKPPVAGKTAPEKQPSAPGKPLRVNIKKVAITDATIRRTQQFKDDKNNLAELSGFNFSIDNLKNGQTAKLAIRFDATVANNAMNQVGLMNATSTGNFSIAFADDLNPTSLTGSLQLNVLKATGALAELAALTANLQSDVTPTEIKDLALRFQRNGAKLGEVIARGPFSLERREGRFNVEVHSIDRQVLNLAGAVTGIDFGTTTLNSTNQIELANAGQVITASGRFDVGKFQVTRSGQTTPTLDLNANYQVTVDLKAKTGLLHSLTVNSEQNRATLLHAELTSPMNFAWGGTSVSMGDSALNVALNNLNLADWKPFVGDLVSSGVVNANVKLLTQKGDNKLTFDLTSAIENLSAAAGGNKISQAGVNFTTHGQALDLQQFQFTDYQLRVTRLQQPVASLSGSGSYNLTNQTADMQVDLSASLANLLAAFPQPNASAQSGTLNLKAHVTQKQNTQTVSGTLALTDLTGRLSGNEFRGYGSDMNLDLAVNNQIVQLRQIAGKLHQGANAGGSFNLSGQYDLTHQSGKFDIKLDGLNENAVRPFLEPMLAGKKLVSVNISATATAQYDPNGSSSVKADAQVTKLLVSDPKSQLPATPLEAKLQLDTSLQKQIADVRQFQITLTPTARGKNEVQLSGRVDMSKTNATQGSLKLLADSLDLTSYYDLFSGQSATAAKPGSPAITAAPAPTSSQPETEPAAINLPFQNFTVEASIGKLYLHEVEIANFQTTLKLDSGRLLLKPFQLSLNGRPVTASVDVDCSVPGYRYDVAFNADAVPLTPLVNTFQPDRKGQIGGTAVAKLQIKGAGMTGANLQKNLAGQFNVATTNMNLAVINIRDRYMVTLINTITTIPELLRNPKAQITELATNFKAGRSDTGFAGEINKSPINVVALRGSTGSGKIEIQDSLVQSAAFKAKAPGTITLNSVLTNSTINFPVTVSLELSTAKKIGLGGDTATNAAYADLPQFITMTGTVGNPKPTIDYAALGKMALKLGAGISKDVTDLVKGITHSTNSASTNSPIKKGEQLIRGIGNLFSKPKTN